MIDYFFIFVLIVIKCISGYKYLLINQNRKHFLAIWDKYIIIDLKKPQHLRPLVPSFFRIPKNDKSTDTLDLNCLKKSVTRCHVKIASLIKHQKNVHGIVPALRQPYAQLDQPPAPTDAQPTRQSVIQFAPPSILQGHIQIAPQIFVPDVPAGGSSMMSDDEICMAAMDEFEKAQEDNTG
ncbi:hypothetical protein QTP88_009106 [Uroleucon formosanum]